MVLEINHHWVTYKLPGVSAEVRARMIRKGDKPVFEAQQRKNAKAPWKPYVSGSPRAS